MIASDLSAPNASVLSTDRPVPCWIAFAVIPEFGAKGDPVEVEVAIMVGEAEHNAILPRHREGAGKRRGAARQMVLQSLRIGHQRRTSTTGTWGTSPAWNEATETWMRSVSNRTGTSNS